MSRLGRPGWRHRPEPATHAPDHGRVAALSTAPDGSVVAELAARVHSMTGQAEYTVRQAAYDLRKLRSRGLAVKVGRSRRYRGPSRRPPPITALTVLREQVLGPILAGCRVVTRGRPLATWTSIGSHYETLRRAWSPSSTRSASAAERRSPHRQHFVDERRQAPSCILNLGERGLRHRRCRTRCERSA